MNRFILVLAGILHVVSAAAQEKTETLSSWTPLPLIFWSPETKFGGGLAVAYLVKDAGDSSRVPTSWNFTSIYTQRKQVSLYVALKKYTDGGARIWRGQTFYSRFPDYFFGIGNETPDTSDRFTPEQVGFAGTVMFKVRPGFFAGPSLEVDHQELLSAEDGGLLDKRAVRGSVANYNIGIGAACEWDDRNSQVYPTRGRFIESTLGFFPSFLGTDFPFTRVTINARQYFQAPLRGVVALQWFGQFTFGRPAFQKLAKIGGASIMRGYYEGRYRDRQMIAAQAELRQPLFWIVGVNLFAGLGDVVDGLDDSQLTEWKYSVGYGLRFLLSRESELYLRLEMAYGKNSFYPVLGLGESF